MEHSGFNTFDLLAVGLLLFTGYHAFKRGFVKEIFMLGTWTGASIIAATYYSALTPWIMSHDIKNKLAADAISAIVIFGIALLALIPTGNFLAGLIKGPTMTSIDRSLGFVFGLMKGLLILCLGFLVLSFVWPKDDEQPDWMAHARVKPLLADGADMIKNFVPQGEFERTQEELQKTRAEAEKAIEEAQHLEELTTPVPAWPDKNKASSQSNGAKKNFNEIIEQNQP